MRKLHALFDHLKKSKPNMTMTKHLNLPRITMIGDIHVYIENHRGISRFTDQEIGLNITNGQIMIKGSNLVIKMLLSTEILIEGKIDTLAIIESSKKDGVKK